MIAMQYVFTLPADYDMGRIAERIARKGPAFDDFPGLALKAFLVAEAGRDGAPANRYAPFYVWHSAEAMRGFLASPAFAALVASFGRPSIRTWVPLDVRLPARRVERAELVEAPIAEGTDIAALLARESSGDKGSDGSVTALDPTGWRLLRVRFDPADGDPAGLFRVLHLSPPVQR